MRQLVTLGASEIDRLVEFEQICFDPTIQASRDIILRRLELGHSILGWEENGVLLGAVAYSNAHFDPRRPGQLPSRRIAVCVATGADLAERRVRL